MSYTPEFHNIKTDCGDLHYVLFKDVETGQYSDFVKYKYYLSGSLAEPAYSVYTDREKFFNEVYPSDKSLVYRVICVTVPGKRMSLQKPKELDYVSPSGSVKLFKRSGTIQYFIKDDDVYLKCNDYFSPTLRDDEMVGTPLNERLRHYGIKTRPEKFVYSDNWAEIILQRKAWVVFENLTDVIRITGTHRAVLLCAEKIQKYHGFQDPLPVEWINALEIICRNILEDKQLI